MMGRLRPGVSMAQAQTALAPCFHHWVAATARTGGERAKLPALMLNPGGAGLFVRTLNKLHSVQLGYARENILLFSLNARQAGHRDPEIATFYADLRKRFESIPGVSSATLSQSSIVNAGRAGQAIGGPMKIGAVTIEDARVLAAGPRFLTTMQIPILAGREIDDRDQPGSRPVALIGERLARTYFGNQNPVGRSITLPDEKRDLEIVGVSANLRYGGLKNEEESAITVFVAVSQFPPDRVTYALRTAGDPLRYVRSVHEIVREADSRIPVTNVVTQAAEIDRTISREVARLESVWLWARNAAPWYGWFCAAFYYWRRWDSRSACQPR